jgi:hypothetical protein
MSETNKQILIVFYLQIHSKFIEYLRILEIKHKNITFIKINTSDTKLIQIVIQFDINFVPTIIFYKNKNEIDRITGANVSKLRKKINLITSSFNSSNLNEIDNITVSNNEQEIMEQISKIRQNADELYHEKQESMLCGLHAINNALQYKLVTVEEMRSTADFLQIEEEKLYEDADQNIYQNEFGNFNSEVISYVLERKGFTVERISYESFSNQIQIGAFIICNGFHWFAVRKFIENGDMCDLDSLLNQPEIIDFNKKIKSTNTIFKISWLNLQI